MRNIQFKFKNDDFDNIKQVYSNIVVSYISNDFSLYTNDGIGDSMLQPENSCITINFDLKTKRVCGLNGYVGDLSKLPRKTIDFRNVDSGILYVDSNENFVHGIAYEFYYNSKMYFDKDNNILSIGEFSKDIKTYKILKNVYVQFNGNLSCLLISFNKK